MLSGTSAIPLVRSHALSGKIWDSDASSHEGSCAYWEYVSCRMGLNLFSMQLNEMTPGLEAKLPPNDIRWRKDLRAIEKGDYAQVCTLLAHKG